jgi:anti-sigma factor RsiW
MSCECNEELLARYAENDLTAEERRRADEHLAACDRCRMSLALYGSLESSLVARGAERPSDRAASRRVMKRIRREERFSFISSPRGALVIISSVVLLSVILTIVFAVLLGTSPEPGGVPSTGMERYVTGIPDLIAHALGGEIWVIVTVYVALALLFAAAGSLTVKYARY